VIPLPMPQNLCRHHARLTSVHDFLTLPSLNCTAGISPGAH
jgi:hypothetical protein